MVRDQVEGSPQPFVSSRPGIRRWLALAGAMFFLLMLIGGWYSSTRFVSFVAASTLSESAQAREAPKAISKPWGDIECVPITIAPPLEFIPESAHPVSHELVWRFPNMDREQVTSYFKRLGVSTPLRDKLQSIVAMDPSCTGFAVRPDRQMVLGLSPSDRAGLYVALAQLAGNIDQFKAFRFCGQDPAEWFGGAAISRETKELVSSLIYRHGRYMFFADLQMVEDLLPSSKERLLLIKTLSQERTFLMRLVVNPKTDVDALIAYWGRRGMTKDIQPILESLTRCGEKQWLGISHLLPPFARARMYTYPVPLESALALNRDCHWTSFNFFSFEPDDRFCDLNMVVKTLGQDYYRVFGDFKVGDLVLFSTGRDKIFHSAIYIADDIVFTKNGSIATRPWILMKLDDLKEYYPTVEPVDVRFYRRTDI